MDQYALWLAHRSMTAMGYGDLLAPLGHRQAYYLTTSEAFKLAGLARVPAIAARMAAGEHWLGALTRAQAGPG